VKGGSVIAFAYSLINIALIKETVVAESAAGWKTIYLSC